MLWRLSSSVKAAEDELYAVDMELKTVVAVVPLDKLTGGLQVPLLSSVGQLPGRSLNDAAPLHSRQPRDLATHPPSPA
jgi:hypothetical protein